MATSTTARMDIPFFRYPHVFAADREAVHEAMLSVLERGAFILQREVSEFESALANFVGVRHAIGVANGTDSMTLGLRAAGVKPGDEVILPSHTFVATAGAVHFAGGVPILVECGDDHLIDPAAVEAAITPRTTAVLPVHLNGRTCDMDAITAIATRHHLLVVEDAAQALGSRFRGRGAGSFGAWGSFSFYPAKSLGCFGDGGAVVTDDDRIRDTLMLMRDHGRDAHGDVRLWGVNSRLDTLHAAVLLVKLRDFDREISRRREIAGRYREMLGELDDLTLPPGPDGDPDHFDTYQNYEIEAGAREKLRAHLEREGVRTIVQWSGKPVHHFQGLDLPPAELPRTDRLFRRCFLLPMNTSLTDQEVDYIGAKIREFYGA